MATGQTTAPGDVRIARGRVASGRMLARMGWFLVVLNLTNGFALGFAYVTARMGRIRSPGRSMRTLWACAALNAAVLTWRAGWLPGAVAVVAVVGFGEGWAWSFRRTYARRGIAVIEAIQRFSSCEHTFTPGTCGPCDTCGVFIHWHLEGGPCLVDGRPS